MKRTPSGRKPTATTHGVAWVGLYGRWLLLAACLAGAVISVPRVMSAVVPNSVTWTWIVGTAAVSHALISGTGITCRLAQGNHLYLAHHVFRIDAACTGGTWLVAYALAVLVMPVRWKRKAQGLLIGIPALALFNLVRLLLLAAASEWAASWFYFIHDRIMQDSFAVLSVSLWVAWMWASRWDWNPGWDPDALPR